jgi:hypothetical protein
MARQYPRFLFSNPQNTKSKGPFVVHTLDPVMIMVAEENQGKWLCANLSKNVDPEEASEVVNEAEFWLNFHVNSILKQQLLDVGFIFIPHTTNTPFTKKFPYEIPQWNFSGASNPINLKSIGTYTYRSGATSFILQIDSKGWALTDGRPSVDHVYASGKGQPSISEVVEVMVDFGQNLNK